MVLSGCVVRTLRLDQAPEKTELTAARVELPSIFTDGPYVDLRVNGTGPYRFLVDTGSDGTSITMEVARAAGISASRKHSVDVMGAGAQFERRSMAIVDRIHSSGVTLEGMAVTVLTAESAALQAPHNGIPNGGIIGMSTLRDVRLEIDYPLQKVTLVRLDQPPPAGVSIAYTKTCPQVTIGTPSSLHAMVPALLDTGAAGGIELADLADYPARVAWVKADNYSAGVGGYWRPYFGQLAGDIRLGSAIWRDAMIHSAPKNRIGSAALAHLKLVIDPQKKLLWLLAENQIEATTWTGPLEPDGRPAVLGCVAIPEGNIFVIKEVDPGSRAERAGLKIGDVVVPENEDVLAEVRLRTKDPNLTRLYVVRGGEKQEIVMSLSEPLPTSAPSVR